MTVVYTPLPEGARFIRDTSFPHQVARRLSLDWGLKIARFQPRVGKHSGGHVSKGLRPQQAELVRLAEQYQAYILTRTQALAVSPLALVFASEIPNEQLLEQVVLELKRRQLLA